MDTITPQLLAEAGDVLDSFLRSRLRTTSFDVVHTVTLTLNGQHGGVDMTVAGSYTNGDDFNVVVQVK